MNTWRVFLQLASMAMIVLIAVAGMPSASLAHPGHAGTHAGAPDATETGLTGIMAEWAVALQDGDPGGDSRNRSCAGPCCNIACSLACASHVLANAASAPSPDADVLARLGTRREALPADPPERRPPKPPRD